MRTTAAVLALFLTLPLAAARRRAVSPAVPDNGVCTVRGLANLYLSFDGGQTFSRNGETPTFGGTRGVAVFEDDPRSLVIAVNSEVWDSHDSGCTWTLRYTLADPIHHPLRTVAGSRGRAFVWTEELALRDDGGDVVTIKLPEQIGGLGIDRSNPDHVRIAGLLSAQLYESFDGGGTWKPIGSSLGRFVADAAFDPDDFDHILLGIPTQGLIATRDAGRTWSSTGSPFSGTVYPCRVEFVLHSPNVVWAATVTRAGKPSVFRSTDGGSQFEPIGPIDGVENRVCTQFATRPFDPDVAVVPLGTVRAFDAVTKRVTDWSCCGISISTVTFSPADANVIYVYGR